MANYTDPNVPEDKRLRQDSVEIEKRKRSSILMIVGLFILILLIGLYLFSTSPQVDTVNQPMVVPPDTTPAATTPTTTPPATTTTPAP